MTGGIGGANAGTCELMGEARQGGIPGLAIATFASIGAVPAMAATMEWSGGFATDVVLGGRQVTKASAGGNPEKTSMSLEFEIYRASARLSVAPMMDWTEKDA